MILNSMIYTEEGKSMGVKTISTKLHREEFTRLQYHCKTNKEAINSFLVGISIPKKQGDIIGGEEILK